MTPLACRMLAAALLAGFAASPAVPQAASPTFSCDVKSNYVQWTQIPGSHPPHPSLSGRLQMLGTREDQFNPSAQAMIQNGDGTKMAGVRILRFNRAKRLMVEAIINTAPDRETKHVLGSISPEDSLEFYIAVENGRFILRANQLHYETDFPDDNTGATGLSCSSGKFEFTELKPGELAVRPAD